MSELSQRMAKLGATEFSSMKPPEKLFMSVYGPVGSGKTSLLLSAPKPLVIIDLDMGIRRAKTLDKKPPKDVYLHQFEMPVRGLDKKDYMAVWEKIIGRVNLLIADKDIASIGIDTGTALYELCLLSHWGKAEKLMPIMYGAPNGSFRSDLLNPLQRAVASDAKNVIMLHWAKAEYEAVLTADGKARVDNKGEELRVKTGYTIRDGWKGLGASLDLEVACNVERENKKRAKYVCEVTLNKRDTSKEGTRLENSNITLPNIADLCVEVEW